MSKGEFMTDNIVVYRDWWGGFEDNCETPLRLVFSWPRLESNVYLIQVTAFAACLSLLVFGKLMLPEELQGMPTEG